MAGEIVNMEKLAEAQEAADTAMEAAMLAAEKVAEVVRAADPDAKPVRLTDQRINTTLRIEPAVLGDAAVEDGRKVNDLILEGVHHILESATEGLMARDLGHFLQPQAHRPVQVQHTAAPRWRSGVRTSSMT